MKKNSIPKLELVFLLLLTGMCPQAHATDDGRNASPQKTYAVDLTLGSATVLTFTEAVTSQTGVLFSYESALSQMPLGDVSVHETAAPLEHILEKVFKGRGFRYKVVDRIVVLTYDTDSARSQLVLVTGRVKDGSGMPLVGASVVVKDTMRGVSAGAEGNYRIFADPDATLVFSYIGYADREERIGTRSAIDVVLEEYEAVLEDVVVVGYGTQSRRTVTAAISKFDGHLLEGIPVNSVGDALKGRVPGVRVATTDATPGADPKFLIRGGSSINQSNDPIVLVDGVVREMAGLNPNDIESVSFLKDAAAAGIYGSRASNGVILITTKKGSKHLGPRIVFEGQWAWASPATKFDLMNARDYILTVRPALMEGYCGGMDPASVLGGEQSAGTGNTAKSLWTTRYLRPDEPVPAGYQWVEDPVNPGRIIVFEDNDQQSQWFGDACWQNYYVGIDGGGDNIQYAASAGYTDDSGIGITTGYSRFTFHGNTTFQVTRRLRASTTFDYSQIEQQTFESAPLSLRNSVIRGLSVPNTHRDWYGEEAGEELAGTPALGTNNTTIPAAYYAYYYHNAGSTIKRSTATINLDWEVFDGLRLVGQFTNYNRHTRSYFYVEDNPTTGSNIRPMKEGFSETNRMDFQAYADYKGTFGNGHRLGAVAGYEYMLDKLNSFDVRVQGAVSDKLPVLDAGTSNIANYPKSTRTRECLISYFGRVNYDYGGRYLLAATMRIDGSSKFAAGHRWGYFPAASAGWVVSKEGFWPQNSAVSMLKVRFSAQAYSEKYDGSGADAGKILVKAVRGAVLGAKGAITGTVTEVSAADPVDISAAKARFREFEATLTNVTPDCRIVISTSEKRALLDNVVVTCTAITPATKPAAPGGVSFDAAAAADRLTLKWNAVPDATSYTVAYWKGSASAPESEYAYKTGIASTATSQELTNLESNTSYWAKVKAVGSLDSDWSETANATTMDSGGEPLLPTADLLDVVFRNDGSAMDNSSSATPVRRMPSSRP